jgi:putative transposase
LCSFFKVSRQGFYKALVARKKTEEQEAAIVKMVLEERITHKRMGGKKLHRKIENKMDSAKAWISRDKFFDLLKRKDLLVKRKRKYAVTTDSYHHFRVHENLVSDWAPQRPNELWVSDITYLRTKSGFVYLSLLTDAYSRKIVGWNLSRSLAIEGAMQALRAALKQKKDNHKLIHHSDRGIQYCCKEYVQLLQEYKVRISMAAAGNCYENAMAERVNGILKDEYGLDETFADEKEALKAVRQAISAYNEKRPHWSLDLRTPSEVHSAMSYTHINVDSKKEKKNQKKKKNSSSNSVNFF